MFFSRQTTRNTTARPTGSSSQKTQNEKTESQNVDIRKITQPIIEIQTYLASHKLSSGEALFESICEQPFFIPEKYSIIVREIVYLSIIRPSHITQIADCLQLLSMIDDSFQFSELIFDYSIEFEIFKLLRILTFSCGIYTLDYIKNKIIKAENADCAIFFADEFPDLLDKCLEWGYSDKYRNAYKIAKKYKNQKTLLSQAIDFGWTSTSEGFLIKKDNIDTVKTIFPTTNAMNRSIEWSGFEWYPKPEQTTLISCAALFGSYEIFKWCIVSKIVITDSVVDAALIGGNELILKLISDNKKDALTARERMKTMHVYNLVDNLKTYKFSPQISTLAKEKCRTYKSYIDASSNGYAFRTSNNNKSRNAFHYLAENGNLELIKHFSVYSSSMRVKTSINENCLSLSVKSGNTKLVDYVLGLKMFDAKTKWGLDYGLIQAAALSGSIKMIKHMKTLELDIHESDETDLNIILFAAQSNSVTLMKYLVRYENYSLNFVAKSGLSVLYYAVSLRNTEIVQYIINHKISVYDDPMCDRIKAIASSNGFSMLLK